MVSSKRRFAHRDPVASRLRAGSDAAILQARPAALQRVERRAECAVGFERHDALLQLVAEVGGHAQTRRELDLNPVAREIEVRDPPLDVPARAAIQRGAAEDDVVAFLEPDAEMRGRRLVVGQVEPERRARWHRS